MNEPPAQAALIERVRALLADQPCVREVPMFGGRSFMVDDRMVASALADGDLLVRVAPERDDAMLGLPGATPAQMGAGRTMGPGWISVTARTIASQEQLSVWIEAALADRRAVKAGR